MCEAPTRCPDARHYSDMGALAVRELLIVAIAVLATLLRPARADTVGITMPAVTPYRPTVSTPAALSAPGWSEIEAGVVTSEGGYPERRDSFPYTFKYAFSPDWGVRLQGEALVRGFDPDRRHTIGFGDTAFVLKRRFAVNEYSAFGLEVGVGAATAPPGLNSGSGRTDYSLNGIYSTDFGSEYHVDLNYAVTRLGNIEPADGHLRELWAVALARSFHARWGVVGEFSGTHQSGVERTAQVLIATSFTPKHTISWDCGIARGLTPATPTWSLFSGVTFLGRML